jgi:hypothetical protein
MVEALWPYMRHEPGDFKFTSDVMDAGLNNAVKNIEKNYPPEWRMSYSGRRKK